MRVGRRPPDRRRRPAGGGGSRGKRNPAGPREGAGGSRDGNSQMRAARQRNSGVAILGGIRWEGALLSERRTFSLSVSLGGSFFNGSPLAHRGIWEH